MPPKFSRTYQGSNTAPEKQALLDGDSDDDDFFLKGPNVNSGRLLQKDDRIERLQGEVDEVVYVMKDNVSKVLMRGEKLDDLQDMSENLTSSAAMFRDRAKTLKTQMWWKECKMRVLFILVIIAILAIIFVPIIVKYTKKH